VYDCGDRGGELVAAVPGGEQVDVLAGPLDEPGGLDCVAASAKPYRSAAASAVRGEAFVEGVHRYAALL
jgi:hypothetical protein